MSVRFVNIDHDTPMLLPPDLRDWVLPEPPPPPAGATAVERMAWLLDTTAGKELYGLRKETVEPVFGIIKEAIGFRRFLLRGLEKAGLEWTLVSTSYNLKRLFNLGMRLTPA